MTKNDNANDNDDDKVIIEEPPDNYRVAQAPRGIYKKLLELSTTPNQWGRIFTTTIRPQVQQMVYDLRCGSRRTPKGKWTWEFKYGPVDDKLFGVWAKATETEDD